MSLPKVCFTRLNAKTLFSELERMQSYTNLYANMICNSISRAQLIMPWISTCVPNHNSHSYKYRWTDLYSFMWLVIFHRRVELIYLSLAVREITKSSSTFSATNVSSNMIWFFQLHDSIKMKSNHTGINYNHNDIAIRSHIMIYNSV